VAQLLERLYYVASLAETQLARVHWVRPLVVVEVTYLTWTADNLLRQASY
jgi:ATP-dependent DNA ligase